MMKISALLFLLPFSAAAADQTVLAELSLLERAGVKAESRDETLGLGLARLSPALQVKLSRINHLDGKCGGFEALPNSVTSLQSSSFDSLREHVAKDQEAAKVLRPSLLAFRAEIGAGLSELREENVRATVAWLSSYPDRFNKGESPNEHVDALEEKLKDLMKEYKGAWKIDQITHQSTRQRSLRLHLEGKARPAEIIVLGGHLDSINMSWFSKAAPGADDNASGSADLIEALRVLITKGQPERSIEFFWYAGEESGLLGSAEIAKSYKEAKKNVIAVLQLDMTLFPGSGEFVVGNVSDFTSTWLQQYLVSLNDTYVHAKIIPDECGYACSDHASWYRQGYPTLMPFESDTAHMNPKIHSSNDKIDSTVSFRHSLTFAKIALAFALDLANSTQHQPY